MQHSNQVTLIGYVGKDLVSRVLESGNRKLMIRVATNTMREHKDGTRRAVTTWHDVVTWNKRAEYAEGVLVKGSRVLVRGSIAYRTYDDAIGHTRYITEIVADHIMNLDR